MPGATTRSKTRRRIAAVIIFFAALIAAIRFDGIRAPILAAFAPVATRVEAAGSMLRAGADRRRSLTEARAEIEQLKQVNAALAVSKAELDELRTKAAELEAITGYTPGAKQKLVTAAVIGFDTSEIRSFMAIDAGSEQGIHEGEAVLSPDGFLLGIVDHAEAQSSSIRLLKDPRTKVAASLSGLSESTGIVMPVEGGALAVRYLGENLKVSAAAVAVTSSLQPNVPPGIPIGVVESTVRETETPFQRALLALPSKPESLRYVAVLTRPSL